MRLVRLFAAVALAGLLCGAFVLAQPQADPRQEIAQVLSDLGRCETQLGQTRQFQAAVIAGTLFGTAEVKKRIEAANPDLDFDPQTFKVGAKKADPPKTEP